VYVPAGVRCYDVKGRLTLFILDVTHANSTQLLPRDRILDIHGTLIADLSAMVTTTIKSAMDTGGLLSVDNQIKALQYVNANEDKAIAYQPSSIQSDPFPSYGIILIVLFFVLMVILLVRRRHKLLLTSLMEERTKAQQLNGDARSLNTYEDMNGDADIEGLNGSDHDILRNETQQECKMDRVFNYDEHQIHPPNDSLSGIARNNMEGADENHLLGSSENTRTISPPLIYNHFELMDAQKEQSLSDLSPEIINSVQNDLFAGNISDHNIEPETSKNVPTADDLDVKSAANEENNNSEYVEAIGHLTCIEDTTIESEGHIKTMHAPYDEKAVDHVDIFVEEYTAQEKIAQQLESNVVPPYDEKAYDGAITFFRNHNSDSTLLYIGNTADNAYYDIQPHDDGAKDQKNQIGLVEHGDRIEDNEANTYVYIGEEVISKPSAVQ